MSYKFLYKFILVGDTNVGKSSLFCQFLEDRFRGDYDPTVGVEFGAKTVNINEEDIKLQIWDTAGQETFRSMSRQYYRGSIGGLLVYDITKKESFQNVQKWLDETKSFSNSQMCIYLVGNKSDLEDKREVTQEEGQQFASENGIKFIEVSAKTGVNVSKVFMSIAEQVSEKIADGKIKPEEEKGIKLGGIVKVTNDSSNSEKKGCC